MLCILTLKKKLKRTKKKKKNKKTHRRFRDKLCSQITNEFIGSLSELQKAYDVTKAMLTANPVSKTAWAILNNEGPRTVKPCVLN